MRNNLLYGTALTRPIVCREPVTLAIAGALKVASGTLAYSLISAGVSLAVSVAASWAAAALGGAPEAPEMGLISNVRNATAPRQTVYGTVRKGGVLTYVETTGGKKNGVMHQIITLAGHEIDAVEAIYINDVEVPLSAPGYDVTDPGDAGDRYTGAGWVLSDKWMEDNAILEPRIRVLWHRGNQTSASDPFDNDPAATLANTLHAESEILDANFVGRGCAYLYIKMLFDPEVFANGIPLFSARLRGKRIKNLATGATMFSANAADVVHDYITSAGGLDEPETAIDAVSFTVAHHVSAEPVALAGGGTEPRYEINGVFSADRAPASVLGDMMTACAGSIYWGQGLWKLRPGYYTAPVKSFSEIDLVSGMSVDPGLSMRDAFNAVRGTFVDAAQDFIEAEYPQISSAVFLAKDKGQESVLDLRLPFTTSASAAQRLAKMTLFRGREEGVFSSEFSMAAFDLDPGDIIALTVYKYGWFGKEFEVTSWRLVPGRDGQAPRIGLTLRETSAAAFAWDGDERAILGNDTNLPDPALNLSVANVQVVPFSRVNADGSAITGAGVSWDASDNAFITGYDVEWRQASASVYSAQTVSETATEIAPLVAGEDYVVRVRSVSDSGRKGKWALQTFVACSDESTPSAPTSLQALGGVRSASLGWAEVTQNTDGTPFLDFAYYNVYRGTSTNVAAAVYVGAAAGRSFVDTALGDNVTYHYWVTAVDTSGNESAKSASASATTQFISADQLVDDIRDQIGAGKQIPALTSLPPAASYDEGDYVSVGNRLYRRTAGFLWKPINAEVVASEVRAAIGNFGGITVDLLAVTSSLAAINADLGNVTAGSINTLSNGTGMQINISSLPNATYIYQNSADIYGLYVRNTYQASLSGGAGGAAYFLSNDGYTVQVLQTEIASGNAAIDAQNDALSGGGQRGGHGQIGLSTFDGRFAFNAVRGGYYDSSGTGYLPFTGAHEGLILERHVPEPGDIVVDGPVVVKKLSDTLTRIFVSTRANERGAVGVFTEAERMLSERANAPAAFRGVVSAGHYKRLRRRYLLARFNALGEGCVNVCGQGGDIEKGDLIVCSDMPGKGMRQGDDLVRGITVARARESVKFDTQEQVEQIACIYLCG